MLHCNYRLINNAWHKCGDICKPGHAFEVVARRAARKTWSGNAAVPNTFPVAGPSSLASVEENQQHVITLYRKHLLGFASIQVSLWPDYYLRSDQLHSDETITFCSGKIDKNRNLRCRGSYSCLFQPSNRESEIGGIWAKLEWVPGQVCCKRNMKCEGITIQRVTNAREYKGDNASTGRVYVP